MNELRTIKTNYFFGSEVSEYGQKCGYVDYWTLSKAFNHVLVNDITKLFYAEVNNEYSEVEQISGGIDNSEQIEELSEQIEELEEQEETAEEEQAEELQQQIEELQQQIEELEQEESEGDEVYQYYIISEQGADILQDFAPSEIVYYLPILDVYIWGVTHYGTSWDHVLTDIKIEQPAESEG